MIFETKDIHRIHNIRLSGDGDGLLEHSIRCGFTDSGRELKEHHFLTAQYALVYIARGRGSYVSEKGKEWLLEEGALFQRFPRIPHSVSLSEDHRKYYMALPRQVFQLLVKSESSFIEQPVHHPGTERGIEGEFKELLRLFARKENGDYFDLLIEMQRSLGRIIKSTFTELGGIPGKLELGAERLRNDFSESLSLEEVARESGMGYHHFRKAFAERFGISPGQYRIEKRISRAMELLLYPERSIGDIAAELGYGDIYTFSAQFKKVTGLSPRRFRDREEGGVGFRRR